MLLIHGFGKYEHIGMVHPETGNDWTSMNAILERYHAPHLAVHFSIYDHDLNGTDRIHERLENGVDAAFNIYSEAGSGFAEHVKEKVFSKAS